MDTQLEKLKVGDRVCKGPDWIWENQGGPDPKGTVTCAPDIITGWTSVAWDSGEEAGYMYTKERRDIIPLRETVPTSEDQSQKADAGKTDPCMFEVDLVLAMAAVTRVMDYGKAKYGARGGWKSVDMARYDSAQRRHRIAADMGELRDPESGLLHRAHEICNALFQLQMYLEENDVDFTTFNTPPKIG